MEFKLRANPLTNYPTTTSWSLSTKKLNENVTFPSQCSYINRLRKRVRSEYEQPIIVSKEPIIKYLSLLIRNLEYRQIAESIIGINKRAVFNKGAKYLLQLEPSSSRKEIWVDDYSLYILNRYREDILYTSLFDATQASNTYQQIKDAHKSVESKKKRGRPLKKTVQSRVSISQIDNLMDNKNIGKQIDFEISGYCHHCKQIKPKDMIVKCTYKSSKMGAPTPTQKQINNLFYYNGKQISQSMSQIML
jgi:hypothetical protein